MPNQFPPSYAPRLVTVRPEGGGYVADPGGPGMPIVGRGATWLEALGSLLINDIATYETTAKVLDEDGNPVPDSFFADRRD